jgi:hypothetical protein
MNSRLAQLSIPNVDRAGTVAREPGRSVSQMLA